MKLVQVKCQNCGATMMVPEGSTRIKCEYCDSVFTLDDEASHIKFDNAKQAGYEFERGRIRAQKEEAARRNREAYDQRREDQGYDNRRTYDYKNNSYRRSNNWDPSQGAPTADQKSWLIIKLVITCLFGLLGAHKFMDKRIGMGILYLFTAGIFGIGVIVDIVSEIIQLIRMFTY